MSLVRIPGQPISFYEQDECVSTGNDFFQLVKFGDSISFQFKIDDNCGGAELVLDGGFVDCPGAWTLGKGWSCETGYVNASDSDESLYQPVVFLDGTNSYHLSVFVENYDLGNMTIAIGSIIIIGYVGANGYYDFYFTFTGDGVASENLIFTSTDGFITLAVSEVSLIPISAKQYFVNLFDADGNFVLALNSIDESPFFTLYKNYLTINLPTAGDVPYGCYYLCVNELCNCITDVEAKTIDICDYNWVKTTPTGDAEWEVDGTSPDCILLFGPGAEGDTDSTSTTGIICEGFSYFILFNIVVTDARVKFVIGTFESIWYDTTGSYTLSGAAITVDSGTIEIIGEVLAVGGGVSITDILVQYNGQSDTPISGKYCSQPIQIYSNDAQFCTKVLSGCNNSDAFGFGFNDSTLGSANFNPQSRVLAKLFPGNYNQSFSIEEDSIGKRSVKYAQSRKAKRLRIIDTAEYLWDWIANWIGLDKMMIDGVDYVIEEDGLGDVAYNKFQTLGTGDIQVGVKTQNMYKTNNSDEQPCEN